MKESRRNPLRIIALGAIFVVLCGITRVLLLEEPPSTVVCGFLTAALMMISYVILDELFKKR
jgi:hypothetical protein